MNPGLPQLVDSFGRLNVLVVGEAMLDRYLDGPAGRLSPEAPVPVIDLADCREAPGGAANTAANVRSLGAQVEFLSLVGDDPEGFALKHALEARGVSPEHVLTVPGRRTLCKTRVSAGGHLLARVDQGATCPPGGEAERALVRKLAALMPRCDAVIVSDYGYGVLSPEVIAALAELQARSPRVLVADSKQLPAFRRVGLTAVKPNYREALQLLGIADPEGPRDRAEVIAAKASKVLTLTGAKAAAVTLDCDGALVLERGRSPYRTYSRPRSHSCAAGAGDTYAAAFAMALAAGADTPTAAELASAASAVVVAEDGTTACMAGALRESIAGADKFALDRDTLAARIEAYRRRGCRVVFTNGCFDILHRGHTTYLSRAKALGDVLVVGVNTDASIRRLKGPKRPINALEDRVQVLAALSCVDLVVPFGEDTPHELIKVVRPDVFVKGGDYTRERLPEAALVEELGGVVKILPFVDDRSTTGLIERIRAAYPSEANARRAPASRHAYDGSANGFNGTANGVAKS